MAISIPNDEWQRLVSAIERSDDPSVKQALEQASAGASVLVTNFPLTAAMSGTRR